MSTLRVWNSADPLYRFAPDLGQTDPQRMNLYTFSLNNPVRYYDPDGRNAKDGQGDDSEPDPDECDSKTVESNQCDGESGKESEKDKGKPSKEDRIKEFDRQVEEAIKACDTRACIQNVIARVVLALCTGSFCNVKSTNGGVVYEGKTANQLAVGVMARYASAVFAWESERAHIPSGPSFRKPNPNGRPYPNSHYIQAELDAIIGNGNTIGGIAYGAGRYRGLTHEGAQAFSAAVSMSVSLGRSRVATPKGKPHNLIQGMDDVFPLKGGSERQVGGIPAPGLDRFDR